MNHPEVVVANAADKIDAKGRLTDKKTNEKLAELFVSLVYLVATAKGLDKSAEAT